MKVPILNLLGEQIDQVELPEYIFSAKINRGLMHQALVRQMANARQGTHKAKTRGEVRMSGAKIYRQKGTGRARHGDRKAPIFVGGGVAHGPQVRSYRKKMPRKMRRAALRSALSVKAQNDDIVILNEISMEQPSTKEMAQTLSGLVNESSVLLLLSEQNENVKKSARNLPNVKTLHAGYLNIRDLLGYDKLVIPLSALAYVNDFLNDDVEIEISLAENGDEENGDERRPEIRDGHVPP